MNKTLNLAIEFHFIQADVLSAYLGGISHRTAEKVQYTSELLGLFKQLKHSSEGKDSIWKQIEDIFVKYATKDSDDQKVKNYV